MDVTLSKKRGSESPGSQRCNSSTKQVSNCVLLFDNYIQML